MPSAEFISSSQLDLAEFLRRRASEQLTVHLFTFISLSDPQQLHPPLELGNETRLLKASTVHRVRLRITGLRSFSRYRIRVRLPDWLAGFRSPTLPTFWPQDRSLAIQEGLMSESNWFDTLPAKPVVAIRLISPPLLLYANRVQLMWQASLSD
ncbi:unnamed protein product [Protopolystoma xenopodis]|uniref:Uncharacterized protein n=1 Tax=Protopolystoma xenopodis TaxID=117903 RepID=A0A3S5AK74_9PLAT|nr:unnamed protein product [Protopolystoma xenopodis]